MYVDDAVIAGVIIVVLTCCMLAYVGRFAYRHIKEDIARDKASHKS